MSDKPSESIELKGIRLLHDPILNKGTAFTEEERDAFNLRGLLPPKVLAQEQQLQRLKDSLAKKPDDLEKYIYMIALQDRNERLFYRLVMENLSEMMPIIYTPTVGSACQAFGHIYRRPRGLYISIRDKGRVADILRNWPQSETDVIVVTDGQRILGLGDLGADGMGIPIGKLSLYTACAGIHPSRCLPITLDVGTNNEKLLKDPLYLGLEEKRTTGEAYDAFLDEFMEAATTVFPGVLIQLEDFATRNAFYLLKKYRDQFCLFDDDIQGTASVAMAGIYASIRLTGIPLGEQRFLFLGAGEAGVGIADLIVEALKEEGVSEEEARKKCWFVDSNGLVCAERTDLAAHKLPYAHEHAFIPDLLEAVNTLKPTALIGVSGQPGKFTKEVVESMCRWSDQPLIFALSNPTANAECTAEQAYQWSNGKAIFASGSPFAPVEVNGETRVPGQGNNVYIFPGVGLGIVYSKARKVTGEMFLEAAKVLAGEVQQEELDRGCLFPELSRIRQVSLKIGAAVARIAIREGLSDMEDSVDLEDRMAEYMYQPYYPDFTDIKAI